MAREPEFVAPDGTVRKQHYGSGRQPWDDIVDAGWGPAFAAGCALKYVRRHTAKNGEDDLEKGRWYFARLREMAVTSDAADTLVQLIKLLTVAEVDLLMGAA